MMVSRAITHPDASPAGRRERNRARTRRALEGAALKLFATRGFDSVTVEQIAEAAEVSPRTFFRYFASKDDVIRLDSGRLHLVLDGLAARPAREGHFEAMRAAFVALGPGYEREREHVLQRNRAIATTPALVGRALEIERAWEKGIASALARREGKRVPDDRLRTIAAASMAMVRLAVDRWLASRGRAHLPSVIGEQFDLLIGSVNGPPSARRTRGSGGVRPSERSSRVSGTPSERSRPVSRRRD